MAGDVVSGQFKSNAALASGTSIASGNLPGNVTAGNYIVVWGGADNDPTTTASKNGGTATIGSFAEYEATQHDTQLNGFHQFVATITGSGTLDILLTFGTSQPERVIGVAEVSGVSGTVQGSDANMGSIENPTVSMSVDVTSQPAFGLSCLCNLQGTGSSEGSGWSPVTVFDWSAAIGEGVLQKKSITSTGATTSNFANSGLDNYCENMLVFTDSGVAPPPSLYLNRSPLQMV